ncbi:MAG: UbiA-like protein EboC [Chloroflexi bacterium]|nr:UbiA-like protein EboC [Chloroflexota bacterium]
MSPRARPRRRDAAQDGPASPAPPRDFSLRAYLELVRLPNLFTAAADVLAGYLTVAVGGIEGEKLTWLVIATVCLYAGGVVLNDYFDYQTDLRERPERPLPSGRVSLGSARRLAVGLLVMAALAGASVGPWSFSFALAIAFAAALYDAVGKHTALGPLNMGLCRFLNFLLGASASASVAMLVDRLPLAALLLVHIAGVTYLSRGEVLGGARNGAIFALSALTLVAVGTAYLGASGMLPDLSFLPFLALFVLASVPPVLRCLASPTPGLVRGGVKAGVLGLVLLDAAFAAGYAGWPAGLAVAVLLVPGFLVARLFAVT